jgi:glycosyltransferase involved in cell wall biosynthesis
MNILFGHPSGSPFSHNAALAHFEAGRLERFCVPWMPSATTLSIFNKIKPLRSMTQRLSRRHFQALAGVPKVQGRVGELRRLLIRAMGRGDDRLSNEANDWLMQTMTRECRRSSVTAVHAYEDCSLLQFVEAKRLGKACIYDMPIGYYPTWERIQKALAKKYPDWLPDGGLQKNSHVRVEQKRQEMDLADIVLVPSSFAEKTIREYYPNKNFARAPYGVDTEFWTPGARKRPSNLLRFIYAGQLSLRKGTPQLIEAWQDAALRDAELELVGPWQLSDKSQKTLPPNIVRQPPCSPEALRARYQAADVFIFPSYFEGFGLVLAEALACGLSAICSESTAGPDIMTEECGRVIPTDDSEALIESLLWFSRNRERLPELSHAARINAERCTWEQYRRRVTNAVAPLV